MPNRERTQRQECIGGFKKALDSSVLQQGRRKRLVATEVPGTGPARKPSLDAALVAGGRAVFTVRAGDRHALMPHAGAEAGL